jgi:hypothetical protein
MERRSIPTRLWSGTERAGAATPLGLARNLARPTQGSSLLATLICSLMRSLDMISCHSLMLRSLLGPLASGECFSLRGSPPARYARLRGTAQRKAAGITCPGRSQRPLRVRPHLVTVFLSISCFSCIGKKMRPLPLRKGRSAACASSCNPRTALGQSVAQPEPRTPGAPNSNGCRSGGQDRQLV